jgi:hypothetical protein
VTDEPLSESELAEALLNESEQGEPQRTPPAGDADGPVVREDGTVKTCIIRPCVSRGARIRNLPPIYTPRMLRENAGVFTNWPMFRDHAIVVSESVREQMSEERDARAEMVEAICQSWDATQARLEEAVRKVGRSIDDLAGRVTRSWWDPSIVFEDDSTFGYQPGGVAGLSLLLPSVREMVSADPGVAHTSINGYPTAGKPGTAPWNAALKGMMIEGIRKVPMGSVDVVVRGGAGGRFLRSAPAKRLGPAREREVSAPGSGYAAQRMADITLTEATSPDQLRSFLTEHAPQLLTVLREGTAPTPAPAPAATAPAAAAPAGLTQADIDRALREAREDFTRTLQQREAELRESLRGDIQTADASDRAARVLEGEAHRLIEAATKRAGNPDGFLTPKWAADLKARYSIRANGQVPPALLIEAETTGDVVTKDTVTVLREQVQADLTYARDLLAEAVGGPVVSGQGGGGEADASQRTGQKPSRSWLTELDGMGMLEHDDKGAPKTDALFEAMVGA